MIDCGLTIYCSQGTYDFYTSRNIPVTLLHEPSTNLEPNVKSYISEGKVDLVINIRDSKADSGSLTDGYHIRRTAVDFSVCLLTDVKLASLICAAMHRRHSGHVSQLKAWDEFGHQPGHVKMQS